MITQRIATFVAGGAVAVVLTACSSSPSNIGATTASAMMSSSTMSFGAMPSGEMSSTPANTADATGPVGAGCAAYAAANSTGAGSISGMATAPVAVAATGNPLLTTLVKAVSGKLNPKVDLVSTLDSSQFTVLAPVDAAFSKVPAATITSLTTDSDLLTKILTYHVIAGQLSPSQLLGTHKTVEGGSVIVTGTANAMKINGTTSVICGGVHTANATVYLIDSVLTPTS